MRNRSTRELWLLLLVFFGCAASHYSRGKKELGRDNYDAAIASLQQAVKQDANDFRAVRDLGIAYFKKNDVSTALGFLQTAARLNAQDALTKFYLGAVYEQQGNLDAAIKTYSEYPGTSGDAARSAMKSRLAYLVRQRLQQEARAALALEAQTPATAPPTNTMAVLYFRNLGANRELDPLQKGLTDMLITDLSQVKALRVVERARLQSLMEEMGLGMTGLVDEKTAPRVGRLLGVNELVNGAFVDLAGEQLRIDAGLFEARSGTVIADALSGPLARFFRLEKDLTFRVLNRMAITPTPEERDAILRIPTENLLAFLSYCKGLDYEDRGMLSAAEQSYQEAARLDPQFQQAKQSVTKVQTMSAYPSQMRATEKLVSGGAAFQPETGVGAVTDRLFLTAVNTGTVVGTLPSPVENETRANDARQPAVEEAGTFGSTGEIHVRVRLP